MQMRKHSNDNKLSNAWKAQLTWGDIVQFRFPIADDCLSNLPQVRPCLVYDIQSINGIQLVTLICGIENDNHVPAPQDIVISHPEAMSSTGLLIPTRFDSNLRLTVSSNHNWFTPQSTGSPVIGRLNESEKIQLRSLRTQVLTDISEIKHIISNKND
jgi:hypothetical protein